MSVLMLLGALLPAYADNTGLSAISKSYMDDTLIPALSSEAYASASQKLWAVYDDYFYKALQLTAEKRMKVIQDNTGSREASGSVRLKSGDKVILSPGSAVVIASGTAAAVGTLSNTTKGTSIKNGNKLPINANIMAYDRSCGFTVLSDTIQLTINGTYYLTASGSTDFNSAADALKALGLFKGDSTGYALERAATRTEALVMFLRLMGEEEQALASTASHPFEDVPQWAERYVAYAYSKGYTKGVSSTLFGSDQQVSPRDYMTFLLRALGYTEGTDFNWKTAVENSQSLGVINSAEAEYISTKFQRAQMAYVSFYCLFAKTKTTGSTLLRVLESSGAVTDTAKGCSYLVGKRMGT